MAYNKEFYEKNKEKIRAYQNAWRKAHPEAVKKCHQQHKEKLTNDPEYRARYNQKLKEYRLAHPEVVKKAAEKYKQKPKSPELIERKRQRAKERYKKHRDDFLAKNKEYREKKKAEINERRRKKYAEDPNYNRTWRNRRNAAEAAKLVENNNQQLPEGSPAKD